MKNRYLLLALGLMTGLTITPVAQAKPAQKTTNLVFAKGSYCTSFSGHYANRKFSLYLMPNQTLTVSSQNDTIKVTVKDPKGRILKSNEEVYEWETRTKGKHTITVKPYSINEGNDSIEFCAY